MDRGKGGSIGLEGRTSTAKSVLTFVWALVAVGLSIGAWSASTPLGAAPDEPAHVAQAAAAVRGEFDAHQVEFKFFGIPAGRIAIVKVPAWVSSIYAEQACFAKRPTVSAGCAPAVGDDTHEAQALTQFSNYPQLYYLIVGVPSLLATGGGALYGMQYTGALLDSILIALGLFLLARYHPRRLVLLGALVALSPMVLFLSAVVTSSGLEIAAGFAAWCGGLCVIERTHVPRGLAALTSLAFVMLILSRPLSPINAAWIIVVLATVAGRERGRALLVSTSTRPIWISVLGATMVAGVFLAIAGTPALTGLPEQPPLSFMGSIWLTLRMTGGRLRQCIGDFGWLDTPVPQLVVVVWAAAVAGLAAYGLAMSARCRRALPLLALAIVTMPVIFEAPQTNTVGLYWQGRYWLPLAVGIPLLAASRAPRHALPLRLSPPLRLVGFVGVGIVLTTAQIASFLTALHRYETGLGAKPGSPVRWTPQGGTVLVVTMVVLGQLLLVGLATWRYLDGGSMSSEPRPPAQRPSNSQPVTVESSP